MTIQYPRFIRTTALALLACAVTAHANVRLPAIFSDHMVLQSGQPVPVWGTADVGEKVTVSVADQTKTAEAGKDGKWQVTLAPLTAGGALTMTVAGKNTLRIDDVVVGEVWLCSGQSNMALTVNKAADFAREQTAATWPGVRTFTTKWVLCTPETVGTFSAVAYFFGREIHQKTGAAVGLINRSAGGSPIELWTSLAAQEAVPVLRSLLAESDRVAAGNAAQAESDRKQAIEVEGKQAAGAQKRAPGYLFEDRIVPLAPYAMRGVIWYQGEANSYTSHAHLYGQQLAVMIADWRKRWGYDFAFLSVQLPELGKPQVAPAEDSGRVFVREGVLKSLELPNTGIAVTLGTGEAANNHPTNKQDVGRRLAAWALAKVYGRTDVAASGPLASGHKIVDGKVVVSFTHTVGGLVARGGGELKGFAIAGADGRWAWADARIDGETVIVSNPTINAPAAVRYAWATNPQASNLYNGAGLPASPFRTDTADLSPPQR